MSLGAIVGCNPNQPSGNGSAAKGGKHSEFDVNESIQAAKQYVAMGDKQKAQELARKILLSAPDSPYAQWEVVTIFRSLGLHSEASDLIEQIPAGEVVARGQIAEAFDSLLQSKRFDQAERFLRDCIDSSPESPTPHRLLAQLLNSQGRRFEASQSVQQLIRLRSISRHELLSLIDIAGPFLLVDYGPIVGTDSATLFGMHEARKIWSAARPDYPKAIRQMEQIDQRYHQHPAYVALLLRFFAESAQWEPYSELLAKCPAKAEEYPEYWQAIGVWYFNQSKYQEASAALLESLKLDPTNRSGLRMLIECQETLEEDALLQLQTWLADLEKLFRISRDATPEQVSWIIDTLQKRVRPWEAAGWTKVTAEVAGATAAPSLTQRLNDTHAQITQWEAKYSQDEIRRIRLLQNIPKQLRRLPSPASLKELQGLGAMASNEVDGGPKVGKDQAFRFDAVAKRLGLDTSYINHYPSDGSGFFLYQANGGGLAVIDYDLDGNLDCYIAQSGGEPFESNSIANQVFRQIDKRFSETTESISAGEFGYGQGVCVGDINQDGFPDIAVANIGNNEILINQGDGTFLRRDDLLTEQEARWTSSIGLADLDGDHLPDLVEVNYIDDPRSLTARCTKPFDVCQPQSFHNAEDQFFSPESEWNV